MLNQCNKIKEITEKGIKVVGAIVDRAEKENDITHYDKMLVVLQCLLKVQTEILSLAMSICNSQREESLELRGQICDVLQKRGFKLNEND